MVLRQKGILKHPAPPPLETDQPCPQCGAPLYLRRGKRGPWLGCSTFPKCKGRSSWAKLEKATQETLLADLDAHEQLGRALVDVREWVPVSLGGATQRVHGREQAVEELGGLAVGRRGHAVRTATRAAAGLLDRALRTGLRAHGDLRGKASRGLLRSLHPGFRPARGRPRGWRGRRLPPGRETTRRTRRSSPE